MALLLFSFSVSFASLETLKKHIKENIDTIDEIHTRLELQLAKAEEQNEIQKVSCILTKINLVRGLLKASQRAQLVLTKAYIGGENKMVDVYQKRISDYRSSAIELEATMDECLEKRKDGLGPLLVFIRPDGESDLDFADTSPWSSGYIEDPQNLPVIPPASPFR